MTKVKICGLSTPETLTTAIKAGADFVGLVFYKPSPRHVEIEVAAYLAKQVPNTTQIVGLFVDPTDGYMEQVLHDVPLTMIQLHGREPPERVKAIKAKFKLPVIKALPIETSKDIDKIKAYDGIADWLLFDAKGEKLPGGNGITFDWTILKDYMGQSAWMLAGGLTPENINEALTILSPDAVDVSSGVESAPGIKDSHKIRSFLEAAKKA
jgi:phosphoribosylanthranilate isomerase